MGLKSENSGSIAYCRTLNVRNLLFLRFYLFWLSRPFIFASYPEPRKIRENKMIANIKDSTVIDLWRDFINISFHVKSELL